MKTFLIDNTLDIALHAEAVAFGNVTPVTPTTAILSTDLIGGNEDALVIADDEADERIVKGKRVFDAQSGYIVCGFAPIGVIESEMVDYTIFHGIVKNTNQLFYKGVLKTSQTEAYTPLFLNTDNAQLRP